jgi:hypothetical protein
LPAEQPPEPVDEIVHVAERPGLGAVAVDRHRITADRLPDERRHRPPVVGPHPLPVGVEDASDTNRDAVHPVIGHRHRLRVALRLVVDAARTHGIDMAPVGLGLRPNLRIAVDLRGRRQDETGTVRLREAKRVQCADRPDLQRVDRVLQIVGRGGRRSEVQDPIDHTLDLERVGDVDLLELEPAPALATGEVLAATGQEGVQNEHVPSFIEETFGQVGAEESRSARHHRPRHRSGLRSEDRRYEGHIEDRIAHVRTP